ncbi:DUF4136 domain-containing protein [Sphingomonas sinipercae]|uniref:DUF4136 domain-containing protein n=1 Tax=Sphingomonas sinipercae TaxID=2714944 RepID=A0A6G7ZML2_9SPHN|nr:DUF4136 domain-containing protein [Sphingomonas sinipercae]QIL02165.1 DUF4136 domain-containing protein [Sphingomonas sinipercae]
MNIIKKLGAAALIGASLALSACTTGLPAKVTRYSAMPVPAGQSFYVVPGNGTASGLQFNSFAGVVTRQLAARGYRAAASPQAADMLVRVSYGVDQGKQEVEVDPFGRYGRFGDPFYRGFYDPRFGVYYGRPYYSRYGYWGPRSPYYYGWNDPFWYRRGGGLGGDVRVYTVFQSFLDMDIVRRADNAPLFEGHARARSQTDELGTLVPNLVDAMFTGFPGRNGETVRITVPAHR